MLRLTRHPTGSEPLPDALSTTLETLAAAFDEFRSLDGLPALKSLEIVVCNDIAEAVREFDSAVIGDESLDGFHTDRIGGVVVGKTMFRDDEHRQPVILMSRDSIEATTPIQHAMTTFLVAHELAHTLIGQIRYAAGVRTTPAGVPWKTCKWLARYAFEEYMADSIAEALLATTVSVTLQDGTSRPMRVLDAWPSSDEFANMTLAALNRIVRCVDRYRSTGQELSEMWLEVQTTTGHMLNALAHGQAANDGPGDTADPITNEDEFGPLHQCWVTLHGLFSSEPLHLKVADYADREQAVLEAAGTAIMTFWEGIGLTFRDDAEDFYIEVAPPSVCWS